MKVEIDLCIPDGYEFVRYGEMEKGEIGLRQGEPYLYHQICEKFYKTPFFIIRKKTNTKITRRYLYEDPHKHEKSIGLFFYDLQNTDEFYLKNRKFIKWLEDDWQAHEI